MKRSTHARRVCDKKRRIPAHSHPFPWRAYEIIARQRPTQSASSPQGDGEEATFVNAASIKEERIHGGS